VFDVRPLVIFYSRTGITGAVASKIAALLDADIERIISRTPYGGGWGFAAGIFHSLADERAAIEESKFAPANYDIAVVGGPVWAGGIACPVRSHLREYRPHFKNTAYFVTQGGSSPGRSLKQMETMGGRPIATLSVSSAQFSDGSYDQAVRIFVNQISSALRREQRAA
jgi:flavodoxin